MNVATVNFTPEQDAAIKYRGSSLLVSAAAGSGKTKVLVERLLSRIDEGANINEFLIITYTRAAAFELREKIYEELLSRLTKSPGNKRLRRQAMLSRGASIDTIHTFCAEILRENAHIVKLPPDFRISDESECGMIMNDVMDDVLNAAYERIEEYKGLSALIDQVIQGRDDKNLIDILLDIYRRIQSTPNPNTWINNQIKKLDYSDIEKISETDCGSYLLKSLQSRVAFCKEEMQRLRDEMRVHPEFEAKYGGAVEATIQLIETFLENLFKGWDEARKHIITDFPRPDRVPGYDDLKDIRLRCNKELKSCAAELDICSADHLSDLRELGPAIATLLKLVQDFDVAYTEEKRRRGVADFSDLEHLTLSLLIDPNSGNRTQLAQTISNRFKEIMVDEYQDVNAVQELIFNAVSQDSTNIFMVGDVKQSIYRFRLADPSIFLSKYKLFSDSPKDKSGKKIHLSRNFRSKGAILEAINHIFSNIMSVELGELVYSDKEQLVPGRVDDQNEELIPSIPYFPDNRGSIIEVDVLDMVGSKSDDPEDNPVAIELEAKYVAEKIKMITNGEYMIPDGKGGKRPASYSDVVILLRSIKGKASLYAAALSEVSIPTEFPGGEGFFETTEVTAIVSLLSVIDNPMQDIPLATVLGGPIYGFSADELAEIRSVSRNTSYYDALMSSADPNISSYETACKCKTFLDDINELRSVAADLAADRFIWHVYNKTGLPGLVSSMKNGERRRNNLILLAEYARRFEQSGYKGLFGFLTYIRNLQERGVDLTEGTDMSISGAEQTDAVRIMSIHKSKGLEFPIVILANASKQFNLQDIRKPIVFHRDFGIGTMMIDKKRRIKYTTLTRAAIQSKLKEETLSEELRVLYVAMTRARERLIVTATLRDAESTMSKLNLIPGGKVAPQTAASLKSMLEWVLVGLRGAVSKDVSVNVIPVELLAAAPMPDTPVVLSSEATSVESSALALSPPDFDFNYSFGNAPDLPSKLTVTGLANQSDPEAARASWTMEEGRDKEHFIANRQPPGFISDRKEISAAERGTLLHLIMQHIDYNIGSADDIRGYELQRQVSRGVITDEQIKDIDVNKIITFFDSPLGKRIRSSDYVKNEFKFSILRPAKLYFQNTGDDDEILLQGVIDCFFEENDELVVVDFKTDRVSEDTIRERAQRYTPQLNAYADALESITGKRVKERVIYFFSMDTEYPV